MQTLASAIILARAIRVEVLVGILHHPLIGEEYDHQAHECDRTDPHGRGQAGYNSCDQDSTCVPKLLFVLMLDSPYFDL